jgi:hypothetical protein
MKRDWRKEKKQRSYFCESKGEIRIPGNQDAGYQASGYQERSKTKRL